MNIDKILADSVLHRIREYVRTPHYRVNHNGDYVDRTGRMFNLGALVSWMFVNHIEPAELRKAENALIKASQLLYELRPIVHPIFPPRSDLYEYTIPQQPEIRRWWIIRHKAK